MAREINSLKYADIAQALVRHHKVKWWVHGQTRRISQPPFKRDEDYAPEGLVTAISVGLPLQYKDKLKIVEQGTSQYEGQDRGYFVFSIEEEKKEEIKPVQKPTGGFTLKLETTYKLDVQSNRGKFWTVVGCGGNGAYLIPQLLRQLALQNKRLELAGFPQHKVMLIDADIVEDKNLTRQNFVRNDVGKNKAEVMANRYGRAFGLEVGYMPEYIESSQQLINIVQQSGLKPVFIGAVDNNKTRTLIDGAFKHFQQSFWIDAGNEEWGGQVVCGYNYANRPPVNGTKTPHQFHLPSVVELYPEVAEATDKLPTELSCAERAVSNPQNIYTNMTAANLIMGFANTILTAKANDGEGLKQHSVAFNAQALNFTTRLNTMANLTPAQEEVEA